MHSEAMTRPTRCDDHPLPDMTAPQPPLAPDYQLNCVWGDRLEDAQSCVASLQRFLVAIEPACPPGTAWHTLGRKDALTPLPQDPDEVRLHVLKPGNGGKPGVPPQATFPAVGFHVLLVTASGQDACDLQLNGGMQGPHAHNELSLRFPRQGAAAQAWLSVERMHALFRLAIACWQPDFAYVYHTDIRDEEVGYPLPIYWLAYRRDWPSDLLPEPDRLPAHAMAHPIPGLGHYIDTVPGQLYNRFNDEHRAASEKVKSWLKTAGY